MPSFASAPVSTIFRRWRCRMWLGVFLDMQEQHSPTLCESILQAVVISCTCILLSQRHYVIWSTWLMANARRSMLGWCCSEQQAWEWVPWWQEKTSAIVCELRMWVVFLFALIFLVSSARPTSQTINSSRVHLFKPYKTLRSPWRQLTWDTSSAWLPC